MNLFNVSLAQTPKSTSASVSTVEPEMTGVSEHHFSQQYQQAIDEKKPLLKGDNPSVLSTDNDSSLSDLNTLETDVSDMHSTDSVAIVDEATELMAVGNVFLQQVTRSNQQLKSTLNTDANAENTSGNSLPPLTAPMIETVLIDGVSTSSQSASSTTSAAMTLPTTPTNSAVLASQAVMFGADNGHGQKSDVNSDDSVNNSPLLVATTAPITATSEMLLGMSSLDGGHLLTDSVGDSRLHQSMGANANSDTSLAQQLTGLTAASSTTNTAKLEQSAVINNAQSPLLLTREQAGEQVHERINMMMAKNLKYVDIRLDPPELGKIQIKLNIAQDQASVQFTVNNPQTRDMVEQAMPRLREMLQQQGLQLTQSSVQQESGQQFAGHQNNSSAHSQSGQQSSTETTAAEGQLTTERDLDDVPISVTVTDKKDQVDYYA